MRERMENGQFSPTKRLINNADLMETMHNLVGSEVESHALFINEQHMEWNTLLLR
jgi:hypothetical protein